VKAVPIGTDKLLLSVQQELKNLKVSTNSSPSKEQIDLNVESNIDNQVSEAILHYNKEIVEGKLVVIGALYDFQSNRKKDTDA
jgi:carbonic anhydrase